MFAKLETYIPNIIYYTINKESLIKTSFNNIGNLLIILKQHSYFKYNQLIDLSATDYPERSYRFEIFYNLLSIRYNTRVTVTLAVPENTSIESVTHIYASANWYERETWDMFGVYFKNHPDLRRILTDYGFKGHPMRKDFPMSGFLEVRYDDFDKRMLYEVISLTQQYRVYTLENSWSTVK